MSELALRTTETTELSLNELAEIANREHREIEASVAEALSHVIVAGTVLNEAYARLPHGEWETWIASNFDSTAACAQNYRRIASHKDAIQAQGITSITRARRFLSDGGLGVEPHPHITNLPNRAAEMSDLRKRGQTLAAIAELYGVGIHTVRYWTEPARRERQRIGSRRRARKNEASNRAALRALQREELAKKMKATGGPLSKAYAQARQLAITLEAAIGASGDKEAKEAAQGALTALYRVEDLIVRANKVES